MDNTTEKKLPVRNMERIAETKFSTHQLAKKAKDGTQETLTPNGPKVAKVKIFARNDGTFDVVWYKQVGQEAVAQAPEKAAEEPKKAVHGLKSKERKKAPKKAR